MEFLNIFLIGNDAISLSIEFSEKKKKNRSKLVQRYPTNVHADV